MATFKTRVRLFNSVPFDTNYEHTRYFSSEAEQMSYFNGQGIARVDNDVKYLRVERGEFQLKGNIEDFRYVNYGHLDNGQKVFYVFITSMEYANPETVVFKFEVDVVQTYMFDMEFMPSFIEREHCKRWNADGTPVINTVPENLDLGTTYVNKFVATPSQPTDVKILLIATTQRLAGEDGSGFSAVGGIPNSLNYYLYFHSSWNAYPNLNKLVEVNGVNMVNNFGDIVEILTNQQNANKVVAMHFLPFLPFECEISQTSEKITVTSDYLRAPSNAEFKQNEKTILTKVLSHQQVGKDIYEDEDIFAKIKSVGGITESKLLFYPYSFIRVNDSVGGDLQVLPEHLSGKKFTLRGNTIIDAIFRANYYVSGYLDKDSATLNSSIVNNTGYDLPIINEYSATYLQGNKNTMLLNKNFGMVTNTATAIGTGVGAIGAFLGGQPGIGAGLATASFSSGMSAYKAHQGHLVKVDDIENVPRNLSTQAGTSPLSITMRKMLPIISIMQISNEKIEMLESYFKMYGYKVNRVKVPNFKTRQSFNFVKTEGANIKGAIPKDDLQRLKGVFDKGITLWHTNDILNYNLSNNER